MIGLHGREEQDFLDAVGVREEHGQSVNTDTPAASGRQTVLQGLHEVLVDCLSLHVTCLLCLCLVREQVELDLRVVKLGVGIDKLVVVAEKLEALDEAGLASVPLGQRGHDLWVIDQEGRVLAVDLNEVADQFIDQAGGRSGVGTVNTLLLAELVEESSCFLSCEGVSLGKLDS